MNCTEDHLSLQTKIHSMTAVRPSGVLPQLKIPHIIYDCHEQRDDEQFIDCTDLQFPKVSFHLHQKLRLNVTFHHIRYSQFFCAAGKSSIILDSVFQFTVQRSKYCGIVPKINVFPISPTVKIYFLMQKYVFLTAQISYWVMDSEQVYTEQSKTFLQQKMVCAFRFVRKHISYYVHHLKVKKHQRVNVLASVELSLNSKVFDGPGQKCKILQAVPQQGQMIAFTATSFQVVAHIFRYRNESRGVLQFLPAAQTKTKLTVSVNQSLHFMLPDPQICMVLSHCVIEFSTEETATIRVGISKFRQTGENSKSCDFSAVILLDKFEAQFKYLYSECVRQYHATTHSKNRLLSLWRRKTYAHVFNRTEFEYFFPQPHESRMLYSEKSNILLIHFFYTEYNTLGVTVNASTTECTVLKMDTCKTAVKHIVGHETGIASARWSLLRVKVVLHVPAGMCVLLQVVQVAMKCSQKVVHIELIPDFTLSAVNISVSGMLKGDKKSRF